MSSDQVNRKDIDQVLTFTFFSPALAVSILIDNFFNSLFCMLGWRTFLVFIIEGFILLSFCKRRCLSEEFWVICVFYGVLFFMFDVDIDWIDVKYFWFFIGAFYHAKSNFILIFLEPTGILSINTQVLINHIKDQIASAALQFIPGWNSFKLIIREILVRLFFIILSQIWRPNDWRSMYWLLAGFICR